MRHSHIVLIAVTLHLACLGEPLAGETSLPTPVPPPKEIPNVQPKPKPIPKTPMSQEKVDVWIRQYLLAMERLRFRFTRAIALR